MKYIEIKQKMEWFGISRNCLCVSLIHTKFQPLLVMAFHKQWNQVPKMPMPNMSNNHLSRNWEKPVQRFWVVGFGIIICTFMMLHPYIEKAYFSLTFLPLVSGSSMDQSPIEYVWWNDRKPTIVTHSSLPDACENDWWRCDDVHGGVVGFSPR